MSIINRTAEKTLKKLAKSYPALVVTGPRQSGKTTITRKVFSDKPYVSLEDLDIREFATQDPRGFLEQYSDGAIFDEVQRVPEIFSYLQTKIDSSKKMGRFILTGSQQFDLISGITQSLAGRVARISLLPFSYEELQTGKKAPKTIEELMFKGLYPPIYDRKIDPNIWYDNYVNTYIERDVRRLLNIRNLSSFQRFIRMCAARTGQLLNLSSLANDCGITHNTAKSWISVLEASYIIYLLQPHHENFNKRLVKSPKLYFYDVGLASWLLNISNTEQLLTHSSRGALFETWVISELLKQRYNKGKASNLYFWRDNTGNEIDVLIDQGQKLFPIEIKSGKTITKDYFKTLNKYMSFAQNKAKKSALIYAGNTEQKRTNCDVIPWKEIKNIEIS